ncbi:cystathionine beta-lyase [Paraferrimonas sedimenticola]|uniref:Cystathionine beta-lyase n=1 Tax=Paraferrimonas sedimenticola TaxID=375674 RepID=A0AA37RRD7_9GAMM|nr:cystathionine beta-lyase [Paraferrimonas sedimenticola]GLP94788.1 cystathionine beta-lyase [Paraferrimonas sedimenticola]
MTKRIDTKIISGGRNKRWTKNTVNPPVTRASTVVFNNTDEMKHATQNRGDKVMFYGRRGTDTHFALQQAINELDGYAGCALYPCGTAAIAGSLMAFLEAGDHLLMVDTTYEPTRDFCDKVLAKMGVTTTYYDPMLGADIARLVQPNTKVIFTESPGSITMEVQDLPAIVEVARSKDILVMLDNTWASPLLFDAKAHGVDVCIQAATKYIVGHSDVMMGTASTTEELWPQLREQSYLHGYCVSPDDAYLALRGLRTLGVRMRQHETNALEVANWLAARPEVAEVRHPAFESNPGHAEFKRDFNGSNGLFSVVLNCGNRAATNAMLNGMEHFKMGYSWGGFESLMLANHGTPGPRSATQWQADGPLLRLHIGLEDTQDLIEDLEAGFARFHAALQNS